jgi:N-acetylglucosamine-6-phosphate deacetylase
MLGIHLEGPFIAKEKMGAQSPAHICKPDITLFEGWQEAANGLIKLVTLAPELPGMIPFIEKIKKAGVICSIGHTNATYAEALAAIDAGCSQGTHLFNAMRGLHQREPGAAAALLLAQGVAVELIADGLHVHPAMLRVALQLKGKQEVLLVTDAMRAKCCSDGRYELGGQEVIVTNGRAVLAGDVLAGSTLLMPEAIKNMADFTGCSLIDAVEMASYYPAMRLGLSDRKGQIAMAYDADLVVLDETFAVQLTLRNGRVIFNRN